MLCLHGVPDFTRLLPLYNPRPTCRIATAASLQNTMLTSSADPRRDEQRHYSSSKLAVLNHDSTLNHHRDQSPRPVVQPVISYGGHGATVTTAGPLATSNMHTTSPTATYAAVAAQRRSPSPAVAAGTAVAVNGSLEPDSQSQHDTEDHNVFHRSASGAGKRDKLDSLPSMTGSISGTKRQVSWSNYCPAACPDQ